METTIDAASIELSRENALDELKKYSESKIKYVLECQKDVTSCLAKYLKIKQEIPEGKIEAVVQEYVRGAQSEGIMTSSEFETILDLLDKSGSFG